MASGVRISARGKSILGETFDEQFRLTDEYYGLPLINHTYKAITESGQVYEGFTDELGLTKRILTNGRENIEIHWEG